MTAANQAHDEQQPVKAAAVAKEAAALLDPSIQPSTPYELTKVTLPDMTYWLMDLRLRLRFKGGVYEGQDADFAVLELTARDAAMLERIADSLDYVHRERLRNKQAAERRKSYSGR